MQDKSTHWPINSRKPNKSRRHQLTNSRAHKLTNTKNHKLKNSLTQKITISSTQKHTNSSTPELTNSSANKLKNSKTHQLKKLKAHQLKTLNYCLLFYKTTLISTSFQQKYWLKSMLTSPISNLSRLGVCLFLSHQPAFCTILAF